MFLEIKEYQYNNNSVSFRILDGITYIIANKKNREKILLEIAGINKSNAIYYNNNLVFDNEDYFKNRIFLDCNKRYLKTLNAEFISESLIGYGLSFNKESFKKTVKTYKLRDNAIYNSFYEFPDINNSLVNISFAMNASSNMIILNNPFTNLNSELKLMVLEDLKKSSKTVVLGLNSFECINEARDKVIVVSDYSKIYTLTEMSELIVVDEITASRNILFIINNKAICYNDYTKEELKEMAKNKIKYKQVTFGEWLKQNKGAKLWN